MAAELPAVSAQDAKARFYGENDMALQKGGRADNLQGHLRRNRAMTPFNKAMCMPEQSGRRITNNFKVLDEFNQR